VTARAVAGVLAASGVGVIVWYAGFDLRWAITATLVAGAVGGAIATFTSDDAGPWDPYVGTIPRGSRLTAAAIQQSLAACDRLARPRVLRWTRAVLSSERDDRLARTAVMRQMRALLGPDAIALLQPRPDHPVTSSDIARCLDALERSADAHPEPR
jgi:hypothetical protein